MEKICLLLATLPISIACPDLMAYNSATQTASGPNSNAVRFGSGVPDYNALPPGIDLLKNAIKNPDGSMTIKAGQQTPEANEINRRYCESLGGKDITNERDQTIGVGTLYAVLCQGSVGEQSPARAQVKESGVHLNPFGKNRK